MWKMSDIKARHNNNLLPQPTTILSPPANMYVTNRFSFSCFFLYEILEEKSKTVEHHNRTEQKKKKKGKR